MDLYADLRLLVVLRSFVAEPVLGMVELTTTMLLNLSVFVFVVVFGDL